MKRGYENHGMTNTKIYRVWLDMKKRCFVKSFKYYKNYGGRGIKVCDKWKYSFTAFLKDMGSSPSENHSIDRINNDGNYEPSNCRWATRTEQNMNQRGRSIMAGKKCSSIYKGVCRSKDGKVFVAHIRYNKKSYHLGTFYDEKEAALAYNKAAKKYHKKYAYLNEV